MPGVPRVARLVAALALAGTAALAGGMAPASAATTVCVAIVVDFGDEPSRPASVTKTCVRDLPENPTGYDVLVKRARQLGKPAPRFSGNFLCAIDGYPAEGCGERSGSAYRYWSYWHRGNGQWRYSNTGAATEVRDSDGDGYLDVEGWHFITGSGSGDEKAPPPASYAEICPDQVRSASPSPRATAGPTRPPGGGDGPGTPRPTNGLTTATSRPAASQTPGTPAASGTPAATSAPPATPTASLPGATATGIGPSDPADKTDGTGATGAPDFGDAVRVAAPPPPRRSLAPVLVGAGLVVALAGGAAWQRRRNAAL